MCNDSNFLVGSRQTYECTIEEEVAIENSLQESDVSKDEIDEAKKSLAVLSSLDVPCITRLNESTIWYVATL